MTLFELSPARETMLANVLPIYRENLWVVPPALGSDAELYGAVTLARGVTGSGDRVGQDSLGYPSD